MSTHAGIFIENNDGTYTGTEVCHDGYIQLEHQHNLVSQGTGAILEMYWRDEKEIKKLCKGHAINSLGECIENTDFCIYRQKKMNRISLEEVKNCGYEYIYIYCNGEWIVMKPFAINKNMIALKCFLDYEDEERFKDNDDFWN